MKIVRWLAGVIGIIYIIGMITQCYKSYKKEKLDNNGMLPDDRYPLW